MPSDFFRRSIAGALTMVQSAGIATRFARRAGVASALSAKGLVSFARALPNAGRGPHLLFVLQAKNKPDRLALVDVASGRRMSYRELDREINQLAHALGHLGVHPGDRVALMLPNSAEYVVAQQALMRTGCAAVQIGYRLKANEIAHILGNARPTAVIVHADYWDEMERARASQGGPPAHRVVVCGTRNGHAPVHPDASARAPGRASGAITYEDAIRPHDGSRVPTWKDTSRSAVIVYTSGTTGKPKGAKRNLNETSIISALQFMTRIGLHHHDRHLIVCPLYHSAAPAFSAMALMTGASVCVLDHFDAERVLAVIERERITCAFMVPTMLARLAELPASSRARYDTSSLRWICSGAAPLSTDTAVRFQQCFGPILYNFYGSTETGIVTLAEPADHATHPGTIGRALFGNEIRLCGEDGGEVPAGEIGDLYVRNKMLVSGYHDDDQATEEALRAGFFSVGDLARVDRDGFYYLESRKHDMIISGGVNIYPREIEDYLHDHPDILEAAIIGIPDPQWGESVVAVVALRPGSGLGEADIIQLCRDGLADYKRPRRVHFMDELPRNPTGKVLKRELRDYATRDDVSGTDP